MQSTHPNSDAIRAAKSAAPAKPTPPTGSYNGPYATKPPSPTNRPTSPPPPPPPNPLHVLPTPYGPITSSNSMWTRISPSANTTWMPTPKTPGSHTNTQKHNQLQHNSTPTLSTPWAIYTQGSTGSRRNTYQRPFARTSKPSLLNPTIQPLHAPSTPAKPGMSIQLHCPTPPAPSLKSSTPKTPKATIISAHGTRVTHTRTCNHSKATNTNGYHTPLPLHHHQTPPLRI